MSKGKRRRKGQGGLFKRKKGTPNWIMNWRGVDGKLIIKSSGTTDESLAKTMLRQEMAQVEMLKAGKLKEEVQPNIRNVTVKDLYDRWLKAAKLGMTKYGKRHGAYRDTRMIENRWKCHLEPVFANKKVAQVTDEFLESYIQKRLAEKAANASINREISVIRAAFRHSKKKVGVMPDFTQLPEDNARKGFVEGKQYPALADACAKQGLWLRGMFEVSYLYGWRSGGLKRMKVSQVNLFDCTLTLTAEQSKNGEPVTVPIVKNDILYRLLAQCISGKGHEDYLFSRDSAGRLPIKDFRQSWKLACTAAGIPTLLFHDLRRTAVSNMERTGKISRKVAMSITGHRTEHVYRRYHIVRPDEQANATAEIVAARNKTITLNNALNAKAIKGNERASESTHRIDKTA